MHKIQYNLAQVDQRIQEIAEKCHKNKALITLLAVSKKHSTDKIQEAINAGHTEFGENYLQEALDKIAHFKAQSGIPNLSWHFIGPIQSNKTRFIAENFNWVHTVDRLKIAQRLNDQRPFTMTPINICIQVNIDVR